MKESIWEWIRQFYVNSVNGKTVFNKQMFEDHQIFWTLGLFIILLGTSYLLWVLSRFFFIKAIGLFINRTDSIWDDYLIKNKFFRSLAQLVPLMFMEYFLKCVFYFYPFIVERVSDYIKLAILFVVLICVNRFLATIRDILKEQPNYSDKPIQSYFQVAQMIVSLIFVTAMISTLTGVEPSTFFGYLGAASAIVLLIFKDTILGFVGSLQMSMNDLVRIGDWITMDKYGADGNVEEINLVTVKIRNFDKTISTIPTYFFISDSFKNWRGMFESEGRRIKRTVRIQLQSVKFVDEELMEQLKSIVVLKDFIIKRQAEIDAYNLRNGFIGDNSINARKQTNIGLFRKYVLHYLQHKIEIRKDLPLLVRQLEADMNGMPLEIYCFTNTTLWLEYEAIQSDVFDHIYSMVHFFELTIHENPTGKDLKNLFKKEA